MNEHHVDEVFKSSQGSIVHGSQGDGPDVVLVHGTPFHSVIWRPVIL
jgi:hypothetical protein